MGGIEKPDEGHSGPWRTLGFALSGGEPWEGCEQRRNVSDRI